MISGKTNRKFLTRQNGVSRKTLRLSFKIFFDHPLLPTDVWQILPPKLLSSNKPWVYGTDGKWLRRQGVVLNHRDITNKENLWWSNHPSESYQAYHTDLLKLSALLGKHQTAGGAVSDWKGAAVAAIDGNFGSIPHQRCLIHVLRSAKKLLPKNSLIIATQRLRQIALQITCLKEGADVWYWQEELIDWQIDYGKLLTVKTIGKNTKKKWWYTHGNLRRAWRLLSKDQDPFFVYLNHELIPKSNNSLEGVNSQLKQKLGDHRGMKHQQQHDFRTFK